VKPISDVSSLCVTLGLGEAFRIEEWRMVSTDEDWTPDNRSPSGRVLRKRRLHF
jgi:hypothetical protein